MHALFFAELENRFNSNKGTDVMTIIVISIIVETDFWFNKEPIFINRLTISHKWPPAIQFRVITI